MKKILQKILLLFIIILACAYGGLNVYRYHTNSPMPDIEYKKAILRDSHNLKYNLEALRPVMGPKELEQFIKENDNNPQIYTPSNENIRSGKYRANLHMHTTKSDGFVRVIERMIQAQKYAETHIKNGYMVIAITDHNTVNGAKEIIKILEKYPHYFKNIKIVLGIEINSQYHVSKIIDRPIDIHVLLWAINPYDKFLNEEFVKTNPNDRWNIKFPIYDFDWLIDTMSEHGIVGIGHPARYSEDLKNKYEYITELFSRYKGMNGKVKFAEAYYQSYKQTATGPLLGKEYDKYIDHINSEAKRLGIIRTGSTDSHGNTIFKYL